MATYRCIPCSDVPGGLRQDFFAVRDSGGATWICREEEPPHLAGSGWEGWVHQATVTSIFARLMGDALSEQNPFEDVARIMGKTVTVEASAVSQLPELLRARKP